MIFKGKKDKKKLKNSSDAPLDFSLPPAAQQEVYAVASDDELFIADNDGPATTPDHTFPGIDTSAPYRKNVSCGANSNTVSSGAAGSVACAKEPDPVSTRLMSIDALRGFNMMFIMGAAGFFIALAKLFPNDITNAIAGQMTHVSWDGFRHHDMIFPLFLFLAGVSFPFSLAKQKEKGKSTSSIYRRILVRMIVLIILGIVVGNAIRFDFANMRFASVLGHIGIAWACAAVLYMNTRFITRLLLSVFILIGYWFLLALVPAPDVNGPECFTHEAYVQRAYHLLSPDEQIKKNLSMEGCIVGYVDRNCLPGRLYKKIHDPEGILSVIPAIVTALLGTMAGGLLRRDPKLTAPTSKALILLFAGAVLIAIGYFWNFVFPINKNLWSSSFVCFVGGISMMALSVFYYIIDVLRIRCWAFFFVVIGVNSITIYLAQRIIEFHHARVFLFDGIVNLCAPEYHTLLNSAAYVLTCWLFLLILYRHRVFLRV